MFCQDELLVNWNNCAYESKKLCYLEMDEFLLADFKTHPNLNHLRVKSSNMPDYDEVDYERNQIDSKTEHLGVHLCATSGRYYIFGINTHKNFNTYQDAISYLIKVTTKFGDD